MRGLIPDHILSARKQGFAPPEDAWYRGPALPYLREVILSPRGQARGYFRPEALERVFGSTRRRRATTRSCSGRCSASSGGTASSWTASARRR